MASPRTREVGQHHRGDDREAREYGGTLAEDLIDLAAREAFDDLSSARIREFVPVFAWRRARARLRR